MKTSEIVRIRDIMQDMRQNFSVGISVARACKENLIAKKVIKGDVDKKYANLQRYVVELTIVNPKNSRKPKANRDGVDQKKDNVNGSDVLVDASHFLANGSHIQVYTSNVQDDASHVGDDIVAPSQPESSVVQASKVDSNVVETSQIGPQHKKIQKPFMNLRKKKIEN
ncbi:hypothetical protein KIW84_023237 [Lathyrus oleraceus]|uniref:Uncharacterized protein n=1 Tax=Pisum sativum TaxID=3888 RepID=A0A9D4YCG8_PEA|nr:hypothetical protein KIW84_023237 [Pisum sativum]